MELADYMELRREKYFIGGIRFSRARGVSWSFLRFLTKNNQRVTTFFAICMGEWCALKWRTATSTGIGPLRPW